jgi:ribonucleotide reductase beta subunit family protein with ferritin-like domain
MTEQTNDTIIQIPFVEELLKPDENRFVMFPIKYNDVFALYKKSIDCFWKVDDVDLSKDLSDWKKLNNDEKHFIKLCWLSLVQVMELCVKIYNYDFQTRFRCEKYVPFMHFKILWNQFTQRFIVC